MKKRIYQGFDNSVFQVVVRTEDWSQGDLELMVQYGEPEVDIGGDIQYLFDGETKTATFGSEFLRVLHGFPHVRGFDARDYPNETETKSLEEAKAVGIAWKDAVLGRIDTAITSLRAKNVACPTEEVSEI